MTNFLELPKKLEIPVKKVPPPIPPKKIAVREVGKPNELKEINADVKETESEKLYVYGIPAKMHSDVIKDYFSVRKNGGGPISSFERNAKETIVSFHDPQGRCNLFFLFSSGRCNRSLSLLSCGSCNKLFSCCLWVNVKNFS